MKGTPRSLERRVLRAFRQGGLAAPGDTLVVAVSGGPDSLALLHALHRLRGVLQVGLHVAHLDHGLRPDSAADAAFVAGQAQALGLPFTLETGKVRAFQREHRLTLEEAAREVRYAFLSRTAQAIGAAAVAVGHTADDQAETVLMHLVRGAGLAGLQGMLPKSLWRSSRTGACLTVARPLLGLSRQDTEAYCQALGLEPRRDPSNLSPRFLRNRFRQHLLPALKEYNPSITKVLSATAQAAQEALSFLDQEAARAWPGVISAEKRSFSAEAPPPHRDGVNLVIREGGLVMDKKALSSLHPALQRQVLMTAAEPWLGGRPHRALEAMLSALRRPAATLTLPGGIPFTVSQDTCSLGPPPPPPLPPLEAEYPVSVPGEARLPGWKLKSQVLASSLSLPPGNGFEAYLDLEAVGTQLLIRHRRPGDRFQPLGLERPKRLQDFLLDAKVPQPWRDRVPLLCARGGIAWVAGWRIAHWARVTPKTTSILHLELEGTP